MDGQNSEDSKQSNADMIVFVQNLLQQMQSRFQTMSDSVITKIDEMGMEGSSPPLPHESKSRMKQSKRTAQHKNLAKEAFNSWDIYRLLNFEALADIILFYLSLLLARDQGYY